MEPPPATKTGRSWLTISTSRHPALCSRSVTAAGSARLNIPGPPSAPNDGSGTWARAAAAGTTSHPCCPIGAHDTNASRPPGRSARPMLVNAAAGSSKNITPNRLTAASYSPSVASSSTWQSPATKRRLSTPSASASSRPRASICSDRSTPTARPVGPAAVAASRVVAPQPQPMSSTRSPGAISTVAASSWAHTASIRSNWVCSLTQLSPDSAFQAARISLLAFVSTGSSSRLGLSGFAEGQHGVLNCSSCQARPSS